MTPLNWKDKRKNTEILALPRHDGKSYDYMIRQERQEEVVKVKAEVKKSLFGHKPDFLLQ